MTQLYSDVYGYLSLTPLFPQNFKGNIVPGCDPWSYSGEAGEILIQQKVAENFSICFADYVFNSKTKITTHYPGFPLQSHIAMTENQNTHIEGAGHFKIHHGHFILLHNPTYEASFLFEKGKKYFAFSCSFSHSFIYEYLLSFPSFQKTFSKIKEKAILFTKTPVYVSREIIGIIHNILHYPYDMLLRDKYIEYKIKDLFFLQLAETYKTVAQKALLTVSQQQAIHEARQIILSDLAQHLIIEQLARKVHLNPHTLKAGFKQLYGIGPFECLMKARLNTAKQLLQETNKPIKEIARIVGYSRTTSFSFAFKGYFGYTPDSLRR